MAKDGGLRQIFRQHFHEWQWSTLEVGATQGGIPDNEFCTPTGCQGWIEFKQTHIFYVHIKPLQVAWLMRRCRYGGNAWIGVRRTPRSQREAGADELWMMRGDQAEALFRGGLEATQYKVWNGGPSKWNFNDIANYLCNR
jgi:hypothetical protein